MEIRKFNSADDHGLFHLWNSVFGDGRKFFDLVFDGLIENERGFVALDRGQIVAGAFIVDGISVSGVKYPYIYGVSTLNAHRGSGLGKTVSVACMDEIKRDGDVSSLHPASASLFDWYGKMGFRTVNYIRKENLEITEGEEIEISEISPDEYNALRREILKDEVFADFSDKLLNWLAKCKFKFFSFEGGCLCSTANERMVVVTELLLKKGFASPLPSLSKFYNISNFHVRTPVLDSFQGFGEAYQFVMANAEEAQDVAYWGFVFD